MIFDRTALAASFVLAGTGFLLGGTPALAGTYLYTALDVTGQSAGYAAGINAKNQVAGGYTDQWGTSWGYVWTNGTFQTLPQSGVTLVGINIKGMAAGSYVDSTHHVNVGFIYTASTGVTQTLPLPNSESLYPTAINSSPLVVGAATGKPCSKLENAFIATRTQWSLLAPGGSTLVFPTAVNDTNTLTGSYLDWTGSYGFTWKNSHYTLFTYPGAQFGTVPLFIAADGTLGGFYNGGDGNTHGFLRSGTTYSTVEPAGATASALIGIGAGGELVGNTFDHDHDRSQGFVQIAGTYYTITVPGSQWTTLTGVNASGSLVGDFTDSHGGVHGFVATCATSQAPCTQ